MIPDTGLLAIGMRSGEIFIVETATQVLRAKLKLDNGAVFCITSLSNKGELIAIGDEGKAYVWSLKDFALLYSFKISDTTVRTIAIDNGEKQLAFGDKNGAVHLYSADDYHLVARKSIHEKSITSLSFFEGNLWSGGRDAKMNKLSATDLRVLESITPHMFTVYGIDPLGNSPYLSTVSRDKTIKIWNADMKLVKNISRDRSIDSHYLSINTQTYHPELGLLATAGDDKMIKVWKIDMNSVS
jgi:WD40 repeat protein